MHVKMRWVGLLVATLVGGVAVAAPELGAKGKAEDPPKMHYTVDWAGYDKPDEKGQRRIVVVIHNTPKGDYEHVVKSKDNEVISLSSSTNKDGKVTVLFDVPRNLTRMPKRIPIRSVTWNGRAVPPAPPPGARVEKDPDREKKDRESKADSYLGYARKLVEKGDVARARGRLEEIVKDFAGTKAAAEAKKLLEKLSRK